MATECRQDSFDFGTVAGRAVVGAFDGGVISSDAGALLLGATDKAIGLIDRFAACFRDGRRPEYIEHTVETLVGQRVVGIALGYEDLIDHDELRHDPVLAVLAGKLEARRKECAPVAGKSTLSRLEHAPVEGEAFAPARYHKIGHDAAAIEALFVTLFLEAHETPPEEITIDLDATEDQIEFPIVYTNAKLGVAKRHLEDDAKDLRPLFEAIVERIPPPEFDPRQSLQLLITNIDYSDYVGRIGIGRVNRGRIRSGADALYQSLLGDGDGRVLPRQRPARLARLRRSLEARPGVPRNFVAAPPPTRA